jgi:hypothetical protein
MIRDRYAALYQVLDCLIIQWDLTMAGEMFQMRLNNRCTLPDDILHDRLLIVGYSFSLDYRYRPLRTGTDAGTKAVTKEIAYEPCLSVNKLKSSFRAVRYALTASRAFGIINTDYFPFH